uniref:Uncharacterized protein n=1 Tax=Vitis vinifera TaxID=29760 RepID=F6H9W1_VITVI
MSSQTCSSQGLNARGRGRQVAGRIFVLTQTEPEEDALLVEVSAGIHLTIINYSSPNVVRR